MAEEKNRVGLAPPAKLEILGENERAPGGDPDQDTTAVVVFHGMGQQVKFETLDLLAGSLIEAYEAAGGTTASV